MSGLNFMENYLVIVVVLRIAFTRQRVSLVSGDLAYSMCSSGLYTPKRSEVTSNSAVA